MSDRLVCICNLVSEKEILRELKRGAKDTSAIQQITCAGTSCGRCLTTIDRMVDEYYLLHPQDPQGKLEF